VFSDPTQAVQAITRELRSGERDGKPTRVAVATRVYDTTPEDLWDALTNDERIPRWFLPVSGDLKLGGRYQLQGNAGGTITRCDPPTHLALTWEYGGQISWVDVRLAPERKGTRLVLEHAAHVPEEFWTQYGPGAVGVGWDLSLNGLAVHIETGKAMDPAEGMAWPGTPDGKRFVKGSSDGWGHASFGAGTDKAGALAAAARTYAFYTGADDETAG